MGYSTVVWNVAAFGKLQQCKPLPEVVLTKLQLDAIRQRRGLAVPLEEKIELRQLSRLTVSVDDVTEAQQLTINNDVVKKFDIIAAVPSNGRAFAHLCKQCDIDIISLDLSHKQSFPISKKLLDCAVQRGVSFEITYAPLFQAQASRRNLISNSNLLIQYLQGRNTILTSGAEVINHIRAPKDASSVGAFLGIPTSKVMKVVREHCHAVINHSIARKQRYMAIEVLSSRDFEQKWPELHLKKAQIMDNSDIHINNDSDGDENDENDATGDDIPVDDDIGFSCRDKSILSLCESEKNGGDGFVSLGAKPHNNRDSDDRRLKKRRQK